MPSVLLVESARDDRSMYASYLRFHDFCTVEIDDTTEALSLARLADVIVTGIGVPGPFDGLELVRRLRVDEATKHKAVIILTARALLSDQHQALSAGCDSFLTKPCLPETLLAAVRRVLQLRAVPRPNPVRDPGNQKQTRSA
jgi:two-component system cell cycle response regulator DivK